MLKLNNVEVKYVGVILVLRGVSLEIREGTIIALLGSNGAGKTTTLKAISGLLRTELGEVTAGTIEYDGSRIDNWDPEEVAKRGAPFGHRLFERDDRRRSDFGQQFLVFPDRNL